MRRASRLFLILLVTGIGATVRGDDERPAPSVERVETLARELGDPDFFTREAATRALWEAGPKATRTVLERVRDGDDDEAAFRARRILWNFDHGILVDTPREVVSLVARFHAGNTSTQSTVFRTLAERGRVETMIALWQKAPEASRKVLAPVAAQTAGRRTPLLLGAGRFDEAERWLELAGRANPAASAETDWGTFLFLTGRLRQRVDRLRADVRAEPTAENRRELVRALAILGELDEAEGIARAAGDVALQREVAFRRGDWGAVDGAALPGDPGVEQLGFQTVLARLAGHGEAVDEGVEALRELARTDPDRAWMCGEALLVAERWDDAIDVFRDGGEESTVFALLAARHDYRRAFESIGMPADGSRAVAWFEERTRAAGEDAARRNSEIGLAIVVARELARTRGPKDARLLLDAIRETAARHGVHRRSVVEAYHDLGFEEAAIAEAAADLATRDVTNFPDPLRPVFPGRERTAFVWWQLRRGIADDESPAESLAWVAGILNGDDVADFADIAARVRTIGEGQTKADVREWWLTAVAEAAVDRDEADLAREVYSALTEGATTVDPFLRVGDVEAKLGNWSKAAEWYGRAWDIDPADPLPVMLQGLALNGAGRTDEGKRLIEIGRALPLGSTSRRANLANGLDERGYAAEARREWETILRVGPHAEFEGAWSVQLAFALLGNAISDDDPLRAADCWQRYLLYMLKTNAAFTETQRYLAVSHLAHRVRARGLVEAGDFEAAVAEAGRAHEAWPANIELALTLVPLLDEAGRTDEANALFDRVEAVSERRVAAFPDGAGPRNDLAWLRARCNRRLDDALADAERAVSIEPDSSAYVDTLAEAHFRRGNVDRAIELAERCLEIDPDGEHYREQLERFRAARDAGSE